MFKFYLTKRSLNEATSYYLSLLEKAILSIGEHSERVFSVNAIAQNDIVITIEAKDFCRVQLLKPNNKIINWFQGVTPEEALMQFKSKARKMLWEVFERITLRKSAFNLFVSSAMQLHYQAKYNYHNRNFLIVPCYNASINPNAFHVENKYLMPNFVYIGSLSKWQCIDKVLAIFKVLSSAMPRSTLSILTTEEKKAKQLVGQFDLQNVQVLHVPLQEMDQALKKYKYGFLIRADHVVNLVSTPTKMSTYLANGIIPIFSDVISAFRDNIDLGEFELSLPAGLTPQEIAQKIIAFEKNITVDPLKLLDRYTSIFEGYYNDNDYIDQLAAIFKRL